jgi:hypothetical protein
MAQKYKIYVAFDTVGAVHFVGWVHIQKEFFSDLMHKNEEIRKKR